MLGPGFDRDAVARARLLGQVTALRESDEATLALAVRACDALVVRSGTRVTRHVLEHADRLRVIGRAGVGLENINLDAARERGIAVVHTPAAATEAVADLTVGLMLTLIRGIATADAMLRDGRFAEARERSVGRELGRLSLTFNEMAAALQRERGQLTEMSITDELTRLKNFRHFAQRLEQEVQRAERYGHHLSLALLDLDHFKLYNDTHGHPAGNEVLRVVGRLLRDNARQTDLLARYGGEEFVIILPETTKQDAVMLTEKICRLIELHKFPGEEQQPGGRLTVSAGVAAVPEDLAHSPLLLDAADRALYAAKAAGRNRVVAYSPEMGLPRRDHTLRLRPS